VAWGQRTIIILGSLKADFLLVLIELFSLGVAAEAKIDRKSAISLQRRQFERKFQIEGVVPHQPFFFSEN